MAGSGHIAGVINAPIANKYQHWTNDALPETLDDWVAGATENPGSWWTHWSAWLKALSGAEVDARNPASGPLSPIEDAPGSFVKVPLLNHLHRSTLPCLLHVQDVVIGARSDRASDHVEQVAHSDGFEQHFVSAARETLLS